MIDVWLFAHVFSAALSIGPFFVALPLAKKIAVVPDEEAVIYIHVFRSAIRLVKHAGHVLVGSGVLLVWQSGWTWQTPWILATVGVMVASIVFLARAFTPAIRSFEAGTLSKQALSEKLYRSSWLYIAILAIMLWLMTAKPMLWG